MTPALETERDAFDAAELARHATRTLPDVGLRHESTVHLVVSLRGDIGVFSTDADAVAANAPGAALLAAPRAPPPPPRAAVAALAAAVLAPSGRSPSGAVFRGRRAALPAAARAALVARVDAAWEAAWGAGAKGGAGGAGGGGADDAAAATAADAAAAADADADFDASATAAAVRAGSTRADFKLVLGAREARRALGAGALAALGAALRAVGGGAAAAAPTLVLRRTAPPPGGAWIGFHSDAAGATAQVPLGDARAEGGALVYALPCGELRAPARAPGVVLAHHGDVAHGVTRLARGRRYALFAVAARGAGEEAA